MIAMDGNREIMYDNQFRMTAKLNREIKPEAIGFESISVTSSALKNFDACKYATLTEAGDASSQLSGWILYGVGDNNTDSWKLYYSLTGSSSDGSNRSIALYKDSGMSSPDMVAQISSASSSDGTVSLVAVNDSGLSGYVTQAYTQNDSDSSNILKFSNIATYAYLTIEDAPLRYRNDGAEATSSNGGHLIWASSSDAVPGIIGVIELNNNNDIRRFSASYHLTTKTTKINATFYR
jgi:hypothetical protein